MKKNKLNDISSQKNWKEFVISYVLNLSRHDLPSLII